MTYDELTGRGYSKETKQPKHSAASLQTPIPHYSSISTEDITEQEGEPEVFPIYSMPDKTKKAKSMKTAKEKQDEREKEISRSRTVDSFFNSRVQEIDRTPSPPPPILPPKPGQKAEDREKEDNQECVYSEASSKPLRQGSTRKAQAQPFIPSDTGVAMGIVSPLHVQRKQSIKNKDLDDIPRSFSTVDNVKRTGDRSGQPTDMHHREQYDMPLTLFRNYGQGESLPEHVRN